MLTEEQMKVGCWVVSSESWPAVPAGSAGLITEDYSSGIMIEWMTRGRAPRVDRLKDGFNKLTELQYLDPLPTHWVPYLMTMEGNRIGKVDMKGEKFTTKEDVLQWMMTRQHKTHPEMRGCRIDAAQEPDWDALEIVLTE